MAMIAITTSNSINVKICILRHIRRFPHCGVPFELNSFFMTVTLSYVLKFYFMYLNSCRCRQSSFLHKQQMIDITALDFRVHF